MLDPSVVLADSKKAKKSPGPALGEENDRESCLEYDLDLILANLLRISKPGNNQY